MLELLNPFNWFSSWLYALLALLPIIYWYGTLNHDYWKKRGVKSPPSLPFIGSMFNFFRPMPLLHLDYVLKYGKFFGIMQARKPILFLADPVVIKRVLVQDFHIFRNRISRPSRHPVMRKNLVNARNEEWKRIRSILTPMFTSSKLRKMESLMDNCVDSMMNSLENIADGSGVFKVHNVMGNFTMDVIAKCAFATNTNAHDENNNAFVTNARGVLNFSLAATLFFMVIPSFILNFMIKIGVPFLYPKELDFFYETSKHLIKKRQNNKDVHVEDMLQLMVKAEHNNQKSYDKEDMLDAHHVNANAEEIANEEKVLQNIIGSKYLSEEEIMAQSMVFFLAGYETTASTLTFCLYELATNPDVQAKLYAEVKTASVEDPELGYNTVMKLPYLDAVISETLRKHPPALFLNREANETYHVKEYNFSIEKGDALNIPVYAIHHLEEYYPNPHKFDPERFMPENRDSIVPYSYLPFGGGPRNCIGMRFALSEAKLGLAQIVSRFELYKSPKTVDKLDLFHAFVLLKTSPIYVGIRRRTD